MCSISLGIGYLKHMQMLKFLVFDCRNIGFLGLSHLLDIKAWPNIESFVSFPGYGEAAVVLIESRWASRMV